MQITLSDSWQRHDIFHSPGGYDEDGLEDDYMYIDIGENLQEKRQAKSKKWSQETGVNGMSRKDTGKMRTLISDYEQV